METIFIIEDGTGAKELARCRVIFGDEEEWMSSWGKQATGCVSKINRLKNPDQDRDIERMFHSKAYMFFSTVVKDDKKYRGMQEVFLDAKQLKAVATSMLQATNADGEFVQNPYRTDNLAHISGLILNSQETAVDTAYICNRLESMRIAKELSQGRTYQSYVQMKPTKTARVFAGDVYVFDGDSIIAAFKGIRFQATPKDTLDFVLGGGHEPTEAMIDAPVSKCGHRPSEG